MLLIDSDVLIWYLRGNKKAYALIEAQDGFCLSVVTYMELLQGMRNKKELVLLRAAFRRWRAKILFLNEEVSTKAMFFMEQHYLSHALELADAFIGATAFVHRLPLLTGNVKHYKIIRGLEVVAFRA